MRKILLAATAFAILGLAVFSTVAANSTRPTQSTTLDPIALTQVAMDLPTAKDDADPF